CGDEDGGQAAPDGELLARSGEEERKEDHAGDVGELAGDEAWPPRLEGVIVGGEQRDGEDGDRVSEGARGDHGATITVSSRETPGGSWWGVPSAVEVTTPPTVIAGGFTAGLRRTTSSKSSVHGSVGH